MRAIKERMYVCMYVCIIYSGCLFYLVLDVVWHAHGHCIRYAVVQGFRLLQSYNGGDVAMPDYGLNGTGKIPFTGWSQGLGNGDAVTPGTIGSIQFNGISQQDDAISKLLRHGASAARLRGLINSLLGIVPGSAAIVTKKQIRWEQGSPGGLIPIETVTILNRVTTPQDVVAIRTMMYRSAAPFNYAVDAGGNGGGGKLTGYSY